jgi:Na+/H+ antiporter NhaD/arsenite permease-like protein
MAAKYITVRALRNTPHMASNSVRHWTTWLGSVVGVTLIAYLVCSGIPIFSSLSSLIGALFGPIVSLLPVSLMWMMENYKKRSTGGLRIKGQLIWAAMIFTLGLFITVSGTYGAVSDIAAAYKAGSLTKPFGCKDNSNSV